MQYPRPYGSYTLLERLGQGGMSEVDLARREVREGGYVRFVVIKRVAAKNAMDESFITMFKDEARINAQLHHQNIAQVYDFGVEGEEFFLAMEYVPGMDLRGVQKSLAKRGRMLPPRVSITVLAEVLSGLYFAHSFVDAQGKRLNVVHRDVNPRNVMLSMSGAVKLIDFGVAKADGRLESTQGHSLKGKFAYMAPEQVESQRGVDHRADLFAVGLMMQELLTGVHPFYGLKEVQILHRVLSGRVGKLEPLPEGLDGELLAAIHRKALAVDPDNRYPDANAFRADLERAAEPLGGLCTAQELAGFLKRVDPDLTDSISERMSSWRSGSVPAPPPPELLATHEESLTLATQKREASQVTARTVVAAGLGGGLVAGLGLIAVVLVGGGVWWFMSRAQVSPPALTPVVTPVEAVQPPGLDPQPVAPLVEPEAVKEPRVEPTVRDPVTRPPRVEPQVEVEPAVEPVVEPELDVEPSDPIVVEVEPDSLPTEPPPPVEVAYLSVTSATKGLEIVVGGRVVGKTPNMLIEVPVGLQTVLVRDPLTGATASKTITVSQTTQNLLKFDL